MFTVNWFENAAKKNFENHLIPFAGKKNLKFLEIGCYEGQATVWLLKNILTDNSSTIDVIDTFKGSSELQKKDEFKIETLKDRFYENIRPYINKVNVHEGYSQEHLLKLICKIPSQVFDFIYTDGSHEAVDVIEDAILSFKILKVNGIMAFDDYQWDYKWEGCGPLSYPKIAIDAFLNIYSNKLLVIEKNYQVFIKKIS